MLYEEFGRALTPTPHFVSSLLSGTVLARAGSDEQKSRWLPQMATGDVIATPAWLEPKGSSGPRGVQTQATADGKAFRLTGTKLYVHFANSADLFLVLARTGTGERDVDIFLVPSDSPGVTLQRLATMATDTEFEVRFDGVELPTSARVGSAGSGWETWDDAMTDGIIAQAAVAAGGADQMLEIAIEFAKNREQFGQAIGSFQSIAHFLADMSTQTEAIKVLVRQAAWARSQGRDVHRLAAIAKLAACDVYREVAAKGVQIHGGVGFTAEENPQLYFRRAKQMQLSWWDSRYLEERIAASLLD